MNNEDLIQVIAEKTNLPKTKVSLVIREMHEVIIESLKKGDIVKISGFGTFVSKQLDSKKIKNPKTGVILDIPPKKVARFKAGNSLKEELNS